MKMKQTLFLFISQVLIKSQVVIITNINIFIFQSLKDLDIKNIDLTVDINTFDNPLSLWPFECCGHFNEKGTKIIRHSC